MMIDEIRDEFEKLQEKLLEGPIYPEVTPDEIRDHLASRYGFEKPLDLSEIVEDVEWQLQKWQVQITHPHYFGLFNPSVTLGSVVADALVAMYNPQLASWRTSPAANEIERHTLRWLAGKFGFSEDAHAMFTTGGSEANLSAVIVALTRAFPQYGEDGIRSVPGIPAIYLTEEAHHSFTKIAHITGVGRRALRIVATSSDLRMDVGELKRRIGEDRKNGFIPFTVIGTAGTTTAGAIDPLPELGTFCRNENLWLHIDAAWAGAAILSPRLKGCLAGLEDADSITCDAHKWFSVPMGCGMFFCRHSELVGEAFRAQAAYMPRRSTAPDPYTTSIQWSRRFIGLKLFLSLAEHGEAGYAEMIERQVEMGDVLRRELVVSGWQVVNESSLPVVCFTRGGLNIPEFLASVRERQIAWISEAQIKGTPIVRACITSFRTTEHDIRWVVSEMNRIVGCGAISQLAALEC